MRKSLYVSALILILAGKVTHAAETLTVEPRMVRDEKAVSATVESLNVIPARVRTAGTIFTLSVREGDAVQQGQVIAVIIDHKLGQQAQVLDAQIDGLKAQLAQARSELERNHTLFENGVTSKSAMDGLRTAVAVAAAGVRAREAERAELAEQIAQGDVLAPASGRVMTVPAAVGSVMMGGEVVATIARQDLVVRLQVPERNAHSLAVGDRLRIDGNGVPGQGVVGLIYPQVQDGLVQVDVKIAASGSYFVGQRLRAWIPVEARSAVIVPQAYLFSRFELDYVRVRDKDGRELDLPVQRGQAVAMDGGAEGVEILSGLKSGDMLVRP